jgi:RNA polymerase sigma-70 factor (ECF subfamily)
MTDGILQRLTGVAQMSKETVPAARTSPDDASAAAVSSELAAADAADILASLEGDHHAYARLVQRYQGPIAAYMQRFTRDRARCEELVHNVFVDAYFGLSGYRGRGPLLHWLKRVGTRVGYRYWKDCQRRREEPLAANADLLTVELGEIAARDAADLVHHLLSLLSPRDRLAITLIHLESNSYAEAGRLTGWGETMVKVQAYRARKRLAKLCAERGIEL